MPDLLVRSFAPFLLAFQPCFTRPSFASFWAPTCAWILCSGRRSLTRVIQAAQLTDFKHYCSFHRFFSQARWNLDDLGRCIFQLLLPFCEELLVGSVDDTLARKSGRHIWGAGMHHDPLRSTQQRPVFSFGHNFVVFSLQVALPFAPNQYWAFPILVRMYRKRQTSQRAPGKGGKLEPKQTGQATAKQYRTRPELALEMILIVASWIPQRLLRVLGDSEYAGQSISRHLPANVKLISRMNRKAALYEPADTVVRRGRRRKKGNVCPVPYRWLKTRTPGGSRLRLSFTERRSSFGIKRSTPCGIPAPANNFYALSWCATPAAVAATMASSPPISLSRPRKSWRSSRGVGPGKFASATSSNFWASQIRKTE
jgi:DDE superfamily endonuclease